MHVSVAAATAGDIAPSHPLDVNDPDQVAAYLVECLHIPSDPAGVTEHLSRAPQDLGFFNKRYAAAIRGVGYAEAEYRRVESVLWAEFRNKIVAVRGKATESDVKACVRADPKYTEAKQRFADAEGAVQDLRGTCDALRAKLYALGSMGHMIRAAEGEYTQRGDSYPGG